MTTHRITAAEQIRRRKETREEALLGSMARDLVACRLRYEDAARRHHISSRDAMAHDMEIFAKRRALLTQLDQFLDGPDYWAVSPSKAKQMRSIARGRLGKRELTLPEAPIRSTNNRVTGISSVTFKNGETHTYVPVKS